MSMLYEIGCSGCLRTVFFIHMYSLVTITPQCHIKVSQFSWWTDTPYLCCFPCSPWLCHSSDMTIFPSNKVPKSAVTNPDDLELWLKVTAQICNVKCIYFCLKFISYSVQLTINCIQVDDELRQKGSTNDMIFNIPFLISYISSIMTLMEGDVILTGSDIFSMSSLFFTRNLFCGLFICSSALLQALLRVQVLLEQVRRSKLV